MKKIILIGSIAFFLTGCAGIGSYEVNVDSIAADDALDYKTYAIVPAPGIHAGLEFEQYANQLGIVLDGLGLIRKEDIADAEVGVMLDYGVGKAQTYRYITPMPQWGLTGYSGAFTRGQMIGNQYIGMTTYTPRYGITGYREVYDERTIYPLTIDILASTTDNSKKDNIRELWQTIITAVSIKPDLRRVFPVMIYAATPYIGSNTGGIKTIMVPKRQFPEAR